MPVLQASSRVPFTALAKRIDSEEHYCFREELENWQGCRIEKMSPGQLRACIKWMDTQMALDFEAMNRYLATLHRADKAEEKVLTKKRRPSFIRRLFGF